MSSLSRKLKNNAKRGSYVKATVVDVNGNEASVRLAGNGALLKSLRVSGGPVTIDQEVEVSYATVPPIIIASSPTNITVQRTNEMIDTARIPLIVSHATTEIKIYHNGIYVASTTALNFVDGT